MDSPNFSLLELCPSDLWPILLREMNCVTTMIVLCYTSKTSKRQVTRFAIMKKIVYCFRFSEMAIQGYLNVLKWASEVEYDLDFFEIEELAAYYGHVDIIKWIRQYRHCDGSRICLNAASGGQI